MVPYKASHQNVMLIQSCMLNYAMKIYGKTLAFTHFLKTLNEIFLDLQNMCNNTSIYYHIVSGSKLVLYIYIYIYIYCFLSISVEALLFYLGINDTGNVKYAPYNKCPWACSIIHNCLFIHCFTPKGTVIGYVMATTKGLCVNLYI